MSFNLFFITKIHTQANSNTLPPISIFFERKRNLDESDSNSNLQDQIYPKYQKTNNTSQQVPVNPFLTVSDILNSRGNEKQDVTDAQTPIISPNPFFEQSEMLQNDLYTINCSKNHQENFNSTHNYSIKTTERKNDTLSFLEADFVKNVYITESINSNGDVEDFVYLNFKRESISYEFGKVKKSTFTLYPNSIELTINNIPLFYKLCVTTGNAKIQISKKRTSSPQENSYFTYKRTLVINYEDGVDLETELKVQLRRNNFIDNHSFYIQKLLSENPFYLMRSSVNDPYEGSHFKNIYYILQNFPFGNSIYPKRPFSLDPQYTNSNVTSDEFGDIRELLLNVTGLYQSICCINYEKGEFTYRKLENKFSEICLYLSFNKIKIHRKLLQDNKFKELFSLYAHFFREVYAISPNHRSLYLNFINNKAKYSIRSFVEELKKKLNSLKTTSTRLEIETC